MKNWMRCQTPQRTEKSDFWKDANYDVYKAKNGEHFCDRLADYATSRMVNANGITHNWKTSDVKSAFMSLGFRKSDCDTWGDIAYVANMAYADYFPEVLKTEADCLRFAQAASKDPDGYNGKHFNRYLADAMGKGEVINWADFI